MTSWCSDSRPARLHSKACSALKRRKAHPRWIASRCTAHCLIFWSENQHRCSLLQLAHPTCAAFPQWAFSYPLIKPLINDQCETPCCRVRAKPSAAPHSDAASR